MITSSKLDKDENAKEIDIKRYYNMIGNLLYLKARKSNIMFNICMCVSLQASLRESYLSVVKRIFKYLKATINLGLWYLRKNCIDLISYLDIDFFNYKVDHKSPSRTCQCLGYVLVS